jgi:rhodanese-related sulfurtransferase
MTQDNIMTVYGVLMTLSEDSNNNIRIANSQVRTLSTQKINPAVTISTKTLEGSKATDETFYPQNQNLPLEINNADFQKILDSGTPIFVLDAREDEEFEIGSFPGSTHLRSADLVAGKWIELPTDRTIYVFCWSGMRGKEVAEFLRTKKIVARYIENGASDWVNNGGTWNGGISFKSKYGEERYQKLFTLEEVKKQITSGTAIVDSRPKSKFDRHHIEGSINIPVIYTPGSELENVLAQVPAGKPVITVCDDFISCFDAKVTGIKLEKRNHEFLGRYNKPWEY